MKISLFLQGHVCPNEAVNCSLAAKIRPVYVMSSKNNPKCDECNSELAAINRTKINARMFKSGFQITLVGLAGVWVADLLLFPEPIDTVSFTDKVTRVAEKNAVVEITVQLAEPVKHKVIIDYHTKGGTAIAGQDFTSTQGVVVFKPGDTESILTVPINPDRDIMENDETFHVVLDNVEGHPQHTVVIEEEGVNKDLLEKSDVLVGQLSVLAKDIANQMAQIKMLQQYMSNNLNTSERVIERFEVTQSNILKSREKYLLLFHSAQALDPVVIAASIDNRLAVLDRADYPTQYQATLMMKVQLLDFLKTKIPLTDRWMKELGEIANPPETEIGYRKV